MQTVSRVSLLEDSKLQEFNRVQRFFREILHNGTPQQVLAYIFCIQEGREQAASFKPPVPNLIWACEVMPNPQTGNLTLGYNYLVSVNRQGEVAYRSLYFGTDQKTNRFALVKEDAITTVHRVAEVAKTRRLTPFEASVIERVVNTAFPRLS
jgi:hypothetical protein